MSTRHKSKLIVGIGFLVVLLLTVGVISASARITLKFLCVEQYPDTVKALENDILPAFEKENPNIKVEIDYVTWDTMGEKLMTGFAAGVGADVITTGSDWIGPYAERNQFLPLDKYWAEYEDQDDFYEGFMQISSYKGYLYGIPYISDIRPLIYRRDFFKEAGLDPDKAPQTWEELANYAVKLTKRDAKTGKITRAGYNAAADTPGSAFFEFWYYLRQAGGYTTTDAWGAPPTEELPRAIMNSPEGIEALEFLNSLVNEYKVSPLAGMPEITPGVSIVLEGSIAMQVGFYPSFQIEKYHPELADDVEVAMPTKKEKRVTYVCPNVMVISSITKHPEESWKLVMWLTSPDSMDKILAPQGITPTRKSVTKYAEYMQNERSQMIMQIPELGYGTTTPPSCDFPMLEITGNHIQAALRGIEGIKEALDKAAEETNRVLERVRR